VIQYDLHQRVTSHWIQLNTHTNPAFLDILPADTGYLNEKGAAYQQSQKKIS